MANLSDSQKASKRAELMRELGEIHYAWVDDHKGNIDYQPDRDSKPHNGKDSDYSLHSLDRSASAAQEDDFSKRTAHILEQLKAL